VECGSLPTAGSPAAAFLLPASSIFVSLLYLLYFLYLLMLLCYSPSSTAPADLTEQNMEIPKRLLDILVCPECKTRVTLLASNAALKCPSCKRVYPVRDEIPCMLPEEATIPAD
jgi:hypothetical protein